MDARQPEFVLFCEATGGVDGMPGTRDGWRFVLESQSTDERLEAEDTEPGARGERLELLAVVRGLEALEQPSHVTLISASRYVRQGLVWGLPEWRESDWQWDRFGVQVPVKNADLWQRVDHALEYHTLVCRTWRIDQPAAEGFGATAGPHFPTARWPALRERFRHAVSACRERWNLANA
jgi:ribonuclease HI